MPPETTLRLHLKNAADQSVPISSAKLFMGDWGEYEWITLTTEGNLLVLPLNMDAITVPWEDWYGKKSTSYRLYIEAEGYAPVESLSMPFIGTDVCSVEEETCHPALRVPIEFPGRLAVEVLAGETKDVELVVRKEQERTLLFVDENHVPLPVVQVEVYLFASAANHCGNPTSSGWVVGEGISDEAGRVPIPDGDYEYLLIMVKPDYEIKSDLDLDFTFIDTLDYPHKRELRLVSYLSGQEVLIELERMQPQRLEMIVRKDGEPATNQTLYAHQWSCSCGLCFVELATTDDQGKISLDFYPEMWWMIYFTGTNDILWEADPNQLPSDQVVEVNLSE